jgi:surface polysaccharide O-acyltransferase-like enzyme
MTAENRQQIDLLRFLLIVGLVFLHFGSFPGSDVSPFRGMTPGDQSFAHFVNSYFLFFFMSAVPLLSAISGYLFFRDTDFSVAFYLRRWRARTRSILLPMLSWNLLVLSFFVAIAAFDSTSSLLSIVEYDVLDMGKRDLVNALVGVTEHPIIFQFWFLRDLLLTILLAPLLGMFVTRAPWLGLAALFAVWITDSDLGIFFRTDVLFFFYVGALLQVRGWAQRALPTRHALWLLGVYSLLVALRTLAPLVISEASQAGDLLYGPGAKLLRVPGMVAAWSVAPLILRTAAGQSILRVSSIAFFLHAIHWPLNQLIKRALASEMAVQSDLALLAIYVATIALTIALALLAAHVLTRSAPPLFRHLSGGRTFQPGGKANFTQVRPAQ